MTQKRGPLEFSAEGSQRRFGIGSDFRDATRAARSFRFATSASRRFLKNTPSLMILSCTFNRLISLAMRRKSLVVSGKGILAGNTSGFLLLRTRLNPDARSLHYAIWISKCVI